MSEIGLVKSYFETISDVSDTPPSLLLFKWINWLAFDVCFTSLLCSKKLWYIGVFPAVESESSKMICVAQRINL